MPLTVMMRPYQQFIKTDHLVYRDPRRALGTKVQASWWSQAGKYLEFQRDINNLEDKQ